MVEVVQVLLEYLKTCSIESYSELPNMSLRTEYGLRQLFTHSGLTKKNVDDKDPSGKIKRVFAPYMDKGK